MIRPSSKEHLARETLSVVGDFLVGWGALALVVAVRRNVPLAFTRMLLPVAKFSPDATIVLLFAGSLVAALALSGFYRRQVMPTERPLILTALAIHGAFIAIGGAFTERPIPRTVLLGVLLIEALAIPAWRTFIRVALPIRPRDTILVGDDDSVATAFDAIVDGSDARIAAAGWVGRRTNGRDIALPHLGALPDDEVARRLHDVEEVILVDADASPRARLDLLRIRGPRGYLLLATHADAILTSAPLGWIEDHPLIEISVKCGYGARAIYKRAMDLIVASLLTAIALPLYAITALAIRLDDGGPMLLRQPRVGRNGVPFGMWKFRSMTTPREGEDDGDTITRVGRVLRRYRLDELPQLFNVLSGDMSLVGPRPERPSIVAQIVEELPEFELRNLVRPGIAGLAQVSAKYNSTAAVKLRYDLNYMCSWSVGSDLKLLIASVSASLAGSGK